MFPSHDQERNLMLFNDFLRETPYSLGEATLAGWGSADDFARARGKYEYVFEPKQKIKKPRKLMRRAKKKEVEREDKTSLTFGDVVDIIMNFKLPEKKGQKNFMMIKEWNVGNVNAVGVGVIGKFLVVDIVKKYNLTKPNKNQK